MKKHIKLCSLLLLAASCAAGCGKKDSIPEAENSSASPESTDFDSLMKKGINSIAQRETGTAIEATTKALELHPESAEAHLLAAQAAYRGEDFKSAREYFSVIAKEASLPSALRAKAYAGLGLVDYAQNDYDIARIEFHHAILLDPRNEMAFYHLGKLYDEIYHFPVAARDQYRMFECLSEQARPGNARAKKVRETIVPRLKRDIDKQRVAGGGNATKAAPLVQEARLLREKKQASAAKKKYDEARKIDPQSYDAVRGYAELVAETEKKTADGPKKAIEAYMKAAFLKPGLPDNYLEAARLAREHEDTCKIKAAEIMNCAVAHHPQNKKILDLLIASLQIVGSEKQVKGWSEYRETLKRQ